jgi:hypothetical protein
MRWSADEAIRAARALADYAPVWLEEPTIPDDVPGHVRIVREGGVPIAAGENLHTVYEFRQLITAGGVTFPEPDVTNCGGVTAFMKVSRSTGRRSRPPGRTRCDARSALAWIRATLRAGDSPPSGERREPSEETGWVSS